MTNEASGGRSGPGRIGERASGVPGTHTVALSTRHLYYSREPKTALIEVQAYSVTSGSIHDIRLDPETVFLTFNGPQFRPDRDLRENPFMRQHWRCGGRFTAAENLNRCGPAVLEFPIAIPDGQGFLLHLGALQIDGRSYAVPDIAFCYIGRSTRWVPFHG